MSAQASAETHRNFLSGQKAQKKLDISYRTLLDKPRSMACPCNRTLFNAFW